VRLVRSSIVIPRRRFAAALRTLCIASLSAGVLLLASGVAHSEGKAVSPSVLASAMPQIKDWLPAHGRQCTPSGRSKAWLFCQGPRRVPRPKGEDAKRATQLGLGALRTAGDLMTEPAKSEWVGAAGPDRGELLLWPVDDGKLWRGLERARRTANVFHPRHKGLDIGAPQGTPIRATKSGIVAYSDNEVRGYGNLLITVHGDGSVALYGHCRAIYVFPGQHVTQGQVIAEVGQTGAARGSHLHFEYRVKGKIRNPLKYFTEPVAARVTRKPGA
jgi:murein DD-endopeptidase MepM/ murein hydrolase activator NlpD